MDLKWDFTSWLPLVSRILPSDICKISKKGACIRLDTTLVDFTGNLFVVHIFFPQKMQVRIGKEATTAHYLDLST